MHHDDMRIYLVQAGHLHHAVHKHLHHVLLRHGGLPGLQDRDVVHAVRDLQKLLQRQLHFGGRRVQRVDADEAADLAEELLQEVDALGHHGPDLGDVETLRREVDPSDGRTHADQQLRGRKGTERMSIASH